MTATTMMTVAAASAGDTAAVVQPQQQLEQQEGESAADRQRQDQDADVRHQDITYSIYNGERHVHMQHIGVEDAKKEVPTLRRAETDFISFRNNRVEEVLQMMRYDDHKWHTESLLPGYNFQGWLYTRISTTSEVMNLVDLFFEEANWMSDSDWTLDRIPAFDDGLGGHSPLAGMYDHQDGCDVEMRFG